VLAPPPVAHVFATCGPSVARGLWHWGTNHLPQDSGAIGARPTSQWVISPRNTPSSLFRLVLSKMMKLLSAAALLAVLGAAQAEGELRSRIPLLPVMK